MRTMPIIELLKRHNLTQRDVVKGTGLALSAVNDIVNERRHPTTVTVNKFLAYIRQYEPGVTYEELFGSSNVA
jgi:transcriptional regulator with XRE-family HTH domain